jgi:riboflavin biosynthesis pyrimidine reductase
MSPGADHLAPLGFPPPWPTRPWIYANVIASRNGIVTWRRAGAHDDPVRAIAGGDFTRPGRLADLRLMRHLRACADAVSVGAQTLRDHPDFIGTPEDIGDGLGEALSRFRASQGRRRLPLQVVYSGSGRLDLDAPIFNTPDLAVIIVTTDAGGCLLRSRGSEGKGITVLVAGEERIGPTGLIRSHERLAGEFDVRYLDCEGGAMTLESLHAAGILDEIFVTVTDVHIEPSEHAAVKGIVSFGAESGRLIAEGRTDSDAGYVFRRWRVNER